MTVSDKQPRMPDKARRTVSRLMSSSPGRRPFCRFEAVGGIRQFSQPRYNQPNMLPVSEPWILLDREFSQTINIFSCVVSAVGIEHTTY